MSQMIQNIFEKKYAECLIARTVSQNGDKGEAIGLALVYNRCQGLKS